jgi:hypothetical protein
MNTKALSDGLNDLLAREMHSLARHMPEAGLHLTPQTYRQWSAVRSAAQLSVDHAQRLSALIESLGETPRPAAYGQRVAFYHYVDLPTLLPRLVEDKREQAEAYRRVLQLEGLPLPVREALQALLEENVSQLDRFESACRSLGLQPAA